MRKKDLELSEKKLRGIAKTLGYRIVLRSSLKKWYGFFDPQHQRIVVRKSLKKNPTEFLFTIAHEIGHCIDDMHMNKSKDQDKAYQFLHEGKLLTKREQKQILKAERAANRIGMRIIKLFNIPLDDARVKHLANGCIEAYKIIFKTH